MKLSLPRMLLAALASIAATSPALAQDETATTTAQGIVENRLRLEFHPVAPVLAKGQYLFSTLMPMQPAGFRSDQFEHYLSPVYGLGDGWQVGASLTGAERIGPGGEALFGGIGLQKQFMQERGGRPALAIGAYGMFGPHSHNSQNVYLAASKRVWTARSSRPQALFLHAGAKAEFYDGDDYGNSSGIRPFIGANLTLTRRFFVGAEWAPSQPWETDDQFAVRGTYLFRIKKTLIGVSGGIRNNGYETHPFIGLVF